MEKTASLGADQVLRGDEHVLEVKRAPAYRQLPHVGEVAGGHTGTAGLDEERAHAGRPGAARLPGVDQGRRGGLQVADGVLLPADQPPDGRRDQKVVRSFAAAPARPKRFRRGQVMRQPFTGRQVPGAAVMCLGA